MQVDYKQLKRDIATKYNLSEEVVNYIVSYPFVYFKAKVRDIHNTSALRIPGLGKFYYRRNIKGKVELAMMLVTDLLETYPPDFLISILNARGIVDITTTNLEQVLQEILSKDTLEFMAIRQEAIYTYKSYINNIT